MVFSYDDKVLINNLYLLWAIGPMMISEFHDKNWKRRGLEELLTQCPNSIFIITYNTIVLNSR